VIVEVAFRYSACVRKRRKQRFEDWVYRAAAPFVVPEVSAADAPVAVRHVRTEWLKDPATVELRWGLGSLWKPVEEAGVVCDGRWFAAQCADPSAWRNPSFESDLWDDHGEVERDGSVAEYGYGDLERRRAAVAAAVEDVLFVDGRLWTKAAEPVVVATLRLGNGERFAECLVEDVPPSTWHTAARVFRLDQHDGMREVLAALWRAPVKAPEIEVLIPEALSYPADENRLFHCGKALYDKLRSDAADMDGDAFALYLAFRDLHKAAAGVLAATESDKRPPARAPEGLDFDGYAEALRAAVGLAGDRRQTVFEEAAVAAAAWEGGRAGGRDPALLDGFGGM
jgi:hypothetical protein